MFERRYFNPPKAAPLVPLSIFDEVHFYNIGPGEITNAVKLRININSESYNKTNIETINQLIAELHKQYFRATGKNQTVMAFKWVNPDKDRKMSSFDDGGSRERFNGHGQFTLYLHSKCLIQKNEKETTRVLGKFIAALTKQLESANIKPSQYENETDLTINSFISITKSSDTNGNYFGAIIQPDIRRNLRKELEQSTFLQSLKNSYEEFYQKISPQDLKNFIKLDNLYSSYLNYTALFFLLELFQSAVEVYYLLPLIVKHF